MREHHDVHPVAQLQLREDPTDVRLHGLLGDEQFGRDLAVGPPLRDEQEDVPFALGQHVEHLGPRDGRSGGGDERLDEVPGDAGREQGLARRDGDRVTIGRNLVGTLRSRELDSVGRRLASETGLAHLPAEPGERVAGTYSRRLSLASGRFAMIDNGLGFQLVPWIPSLERELGRQVNGIAGPGGVEWSFGRKRDLSL